MAFSDEKLEAAIARLTEPGALSEAEQLVARTAPQLQRVLNEALAAGGWYDAHDAQVREAVASEDGEERTRAVRTLLAEETRVAMLVGVAVGYELARQLNDRED